MFHVPSDKRVTTGPFRSDERDGNNGAFFIEGAKGDRLLVIASDGGGWEHVSVSCRDSTPSWDDMCEVKSIFWDDDDTVVQFHPKKSEYVNFHPHCLHLWKQTGEEFKLPNKHFV